MQHWLRSLGAGLAGGLLTFFLWDVVQKEKQSLRYEMDIALEAVPSDDTTVPFSYQRILELTSQRLNELGYDFQIDRKEKYRFDLYIKNLDDTLQVKNLLTSSGRLQLRELYNMQDLFPALTKLKEWIDSSVQLNEPVYDTVKRDSMSAAVSTLLDSIELTEKENKTAAIREQKQLIEFSQPYTDQYSRSYQSAEIGYTRTSDTSKVRGLVNSRQINSFLPADAVLYFGLPVGHLEKSKQRSIPIYFVRSYLRKRALLENEDVISSNAEFDSYTGKPQILFQFTNAGAKTWQIMTAKNVHKPIAIIVSDNVLSAPIVESEISGGSAVISGDFTIQESELLSLQIKSPLMPGKLQILSTDIKPGSVNQGQKKKILAAGIVFILLTVGAYLVFKTLKTN